jgi:hypothetical protein
LSRSGRGIALCDIEPFPAVDFALLCPYKLVMKTVTWNPEKAKSLKSDPTRAHVTFEDCVVAMSSGGHLATVPNPSKNFPNQQMYILKIKDYVHCVLFVESEEEIFLKTIFPNRKFNAMFLKK